MRVTGRKWTRGLPAVLLVLSGCTGGGEPGEIIYAGWNDLFVIDAGRGRIVETVPVGAKINDLETASGGRLLLASTRGLVVVDRRTMEVSETVPLGILDAVEYDGGRNVVYALLHPGDRPDASHGPHRLLRLEGEGFRETGRVTLEPWTYDIFLSPSGDDIYITHGAGRTVLRLRADDFENPEKLWFGGGRDWEGRMVLLRHVAMPPSGSPVYLLEQGESDSTCLWIYRPASGEKTRRCLPGDPRIQGMVTSADGSRIYANGLTEVIVMDGGGEVLSRIDLAAEHRWIARGANGDALYLTASTGEEEGLLTCVDPGDGRTREIRLPTPINVIALEIDRHVVN
jgi:hypothetical protein